MRYKLVGEKLKTFVLVFETNDELARGPMEFAFEQKLAGGKLQSHWRTFIREARMIELENKTI